MRNITPCNDLVFDALVYDNYQGSGSNKAELRRKLDIVYRAMKNELTQNEFDALRDYYIMGKKMKDIADERGVNPSTITRQIHRAKEKIIHIAKYY
ncbi:MAG: sigma-70 family RNA polymerase sigma factor [Clostridia bacterium]|nr:sigma-70 family RNA polymerase sigma factor [Clostridia bacterium]